MAVFDDKKGALSVEVVEAQVEYDEPRTILQVHPHTLFSEEGGYARVEDSTGCTVLKCDSRDMSQKRALRRSFHSRIFDMSSEYGESELTVYPPWSNGRLRFDEHFPRRYRGTKTDTLLDVQPDAFDRYRTIIRRAGRDIGTATRPRWGLGAWEINIPTGVDEPMVVALIVVLMQQSVVRQDSVLSSASSDYSSEVDTRRSTDSVDMMVEAAQLLALASRRPSIAA
ncbi:MAG: hypothetical protein Q9159_007512 [Coniocarpon cinnabarinum]